MYNLARFIVLFLRPITYKRMSTNYTGNDLFISVRLLRKMYFRIEIV